MSRLRRAMRRLILCHLLRRHCWIRRYGRDLEWLCIRCARSRRRTQ